MKRIGIFGGTFDPVHNEHIAYAKSAIEELSLDTLFVIPTFIPPHKKSATPPSLRLKLAELSFGNIPKVKVSDMEIKREGKSYSYLTVEEIKSENPSAELFFLVGADMLSDFFTWKKPERILEIATLVCAERQGETLPKIIKDEFKARFNKDFIDLKFKGKEISSTKVRALISLGLSAKDYIPEAEEKFIVENGIYSDKYSDYVKKNLPEKRRIHTAGVIECAIKLAKRVGVDTEKARITATLHDCAKYLKKEDYPDFSMPADVPAPVEHAFLGAYIVEKVLDIKDEEIISAIRYHTSGREKMSELEKVIFVADMIEENRVYDGVDVLRSAVEKDFSSGFLLCLKEETEHIIKKKGPIYRETLKAFDYYIKGIKGE